MQRSTALLIHSDECGWFALRTILPTIPSLEIVGEVTETEEAVRQAAAKPDLIIVSSIVSGKSVAPLLALLLTQATRQSKAIVLAARFDPAEVAALAGLNIAGYFLWPDLPASALRDAIGALARADLLMASREVVQASMMPRPRIDALEGADALPQVSVRGTAVLRDLAAGRTRQEIADRQGTSVSTVARTIADLEATLDAPSQFVLAHRATLLGLLP